jgi:hypothetical protein
MRGETVPSEVFGTVLKNARAQLILAAHNAKAFKHKGIRGDERAAPLGNFLRPRLPIHLDIGKGEAIDCRDRRSGQLDLIIYDRSRAAPVSAQQENLLIPAEALYAVIEVKTTLNASEWKKCCTAAEKVRSLRPFKKQFIGPRGAGGSSNDGAARCMYIIFAYTSNLARADWLTEEYKRANKAAIAKSTALSLIERVVVLDRGIMAPPFKTGKLFHDGDDGVFLEFYLHLANFLTREMPRRKPIDWQMYAGATSPGWKKIK